MLLSPGQGLNPEIIVSTSMFMIRGQDVYRDKPVTTQDIQRIKTLATGALHFFAQAATECRRICVA
jgi:hypothetical protein